MMRFSEWGKQALQDWVLPRSFQWRLGGGEASALTFDDGPHPTFTPAILDLLERHAIRASFFVVGERVREHPDLLRRLVAGGHVIGSHTQTHRDLPGLSATQLRWELHTCRRLIQDTCGVDTALMRPPRGKVDLASLLRIHRQGYRLIHWSKTYSDYVQDGTQPLLDRIRGAGLLPRDIALFHDNNAHTVEALATALPEWLGQGRSFAALT